MSSSDLIADEAKHQIAVACHENASSSPPVAPRKDSSATPAPSMRRSWSADSLSSNGVKTCVCAPTTHAGSFRCRLHRQSAVYNANVQAHAHAAPLPPPPVPSRPPPPASPRSIEAL